MKTIAAPSPVSAPGPLNRLLAAGLVIVAVLARPGSAAATVASDLCTGDPCTLAANTTVDPGSLLDFGSAEFRIKESKVLTLGGTGTRTLDIVARKIVLEKGATISGGGDDAAVSITATDGPIILQTVGTTASRIDLSGLSAGYLSLQSSGNIQLNGRLLINGSGADSAGGFLDILAGGSITFGGEVRIGAIGSYAGAGSLTAAAGTGITVDAEIDASAPGGFGSIDLATAAGSVVVNRPMSADGGDPDGTGGDISVTTDYGQIVIATGANLSGVGGSGTDFACGDGGTVLLDSGLGVSLSANVTLRGGVACSGGSLSMIAATTVTHAAGTINAVGQGTGDYAGYGGSVDVLAEGDVAVIGMDVSGNGGGGYVDLRSIHGKVETSGVITASDAGSIEIEACTVNVKSTSTLDSRAGGLNQVTGRSAVTIAGKMLAGAGGENLIRMRSGAPVVAGSTITPAATLEVGPAVPACPAAPVCGNSTVEPGELCDDGARTGTVQGCCAAGCGAMASNGSSCEDGVFCNGGDTCSNGTCSQHAGNPCTTATDQCETTTCSEATHCARPAGTPCSEADDNPCTAGACSGGSCLPVPTDGVCDEADDNPCTAGACSGGSCVPVPTDGTCDDGEFCNGAESCVDGVCRTAAPVCSADSCDEDGDACESFCGDGTIDAGETCGEPGLPGCGTTAGCRDCTCAAGVLSNDSYLCYSTEDAAVPGWVFAPDSRTLTDRFESKRYDIVATKQVCVPARVASATGVFSPRFTTISQVDHAIALSTSPAPQVPFVPVNRTIADRYRTMAVTLSAPAGLLMRSKLVDFGPVTPCATDGECSDGDTCQSGVCLPDPAAAPAKAPPNKSSVDNYKCYKAKLQSGSFQKIKNLRITDRFANTVTFTGQALSRVCSPAMLGPLNPEAPAKPQQLTCYTLKANPTTPPQALAVPREVATKSKSLAGAFLETVKATELCVPSQLQN